MVTLKLYFLHSDTAECFLAVFEASPCVLYVNKSEDLLKLERLDTPAISAKPCDGSAPSSIQVNQFCSPAYHHEPRRLLLGKTLPRNSRIVSRRVSLALLLKPVNVPAKSNYLLYDK